MDNLPSYPQGYPQLAGLQCPVCGAERGFRRVFHISTVIPRKSGAIGEKLSTIVHSVDNLWITVDNPPTYPQVSRRRKKSTSYPGVIPHLSTSYPQYCGQISPRLWITSAANVGARSVGSDLWGLKRGKCAWGGPTEKTGADSFRRPRRGLPSAPETCRHEPRPGGAVRDDARGKNDAFPTTGPVGGGRQRGCAAPCCCRKGSEKRVAERGQGTTVVLLR